MNKRRAFIASSSLLISICAGCGDDDVTPAPDAAASTPDAAATTDAAEEPPADAAADLQPQPGRAIGMAGNFPPADGTEPTQDPAFFVRLNSAVSWDADASLVIPRGYNPPDDGPSQINYEAELGIIIGDTVSRASEADAAQAILGYTCAMDGTAFVPDDTGERDLLRSLGGKSFDGIAPLGPQVYTDVDPAGRDIILRVNGEERERANVDDMIWGPARIVSELSKVITLGYGDVIYAGARVQVEKLEPGDTFEVEISGMCTMSRQVVAEP